MVLASRTFTINWQKTFVVFLSLSGLAMVYLLFNPNEIVYFPPCPFKLFTGLECPGCGSQRAVHHLLNLNVRSAFFENALLVISIPYLLLGYFFDNFSTEGKIIKSLGQKLYGRRAIKIILLIIFHFWLLRNLL